MSTERKIQQRTIESRQKLLDAAYHLFSEKGYYNTNTKEIARTAGISIGNFYNYYQDKGQIYCALLEAYTADSCHAMQELVDQLAILQTPAAYREFLLPCLHQLLVRAADTNQFFQDSIVIAKENSQVQAILAAAAKRLTAILEEFLTAQTHDEPDHSHIRARMIYVITDQVAKDILLVPDEHQRELYIQYLADEIIHLAFHR